jgi:hypothetical protein
VLFAEQAKKTLATLKANSVTTATAALPGVTDAP